MEVRAKRDSTSDTTWDVVQRLYNSETATDSYTDVSTPEVQVVYGGDGHVHWHTYDIAKYELDRSDNGVKVGTGAKRGFCFFDNVQDSATLPKYYVTNRDAPGVSCLPPRGTRILDALEIKMGITAGWGDKYSYTLPDQYVDVTGLTAGQYRLWGTVDPEGWFTESNTTNNFTWVDIRLGGSGPDTVSVVRQGPGMPV